MSDICIKVPYESLADANAALRQMRKHRRAGGRRKSRDTTKRPYQCKNCRKWHLTSMSNDEYRGMRARNYEVAR